MGLCSLLGLRPKYGRGNCSNGEFLQKDLCQDCCIQSTDPTAGHCWPMPLPETPGCSQASLAQFLVGSLLPTCMTCVCHYSIIESNVTALEIVCAPPIHVSDRLTVWAPSFFLLPYMLYFLQQVNFWRLVSHWSKVLQLGHLLGTEIQKNRKRIFVFLFGSSIESTWMPPV